MVAKSWNKLYMKSLSFWNTSAEIPSALLKGLNSGTVLAKFSETN